ncbi:MAG: Biopolymer transport protein ExbB [Planctomycetota bacterium]|jgi:biopolymer transport protein ExbB
MKPSLKKSLSLAIVAMVLCSSVAFAQEAPKQQTYWELFQHTGIVGWLMVLCSVSGSALVIEHIVNIRREKLAPTALVQDLEALIAEGSYEEAIEMCEQEGGYVSNLVKAGLIMRDAGYDEAISNLSLAAEEESFKLMAKISYLSLIGNIGPLLGLLGTVTGMIASFQKIEQMKAPTPKDLASGVYESLVNTTLGLFIGIVFLTAFFIYKNFVTKMTLQMNLQSVELLRSLAEKEKH